MLKKHKFAEVPKLSESVGAYRFQWGLYLQGVKPQRYFLRHYNEKVNSTDAIQIHYEKDNFKQAKFKMCYNKTQASDFAECAPVQKGNSLYFFSIEKIDAEVE